MADIKIWLKAVMDDLIGRGIEQGLQVAAYLDGEMVVDTWAGIADATTGRMVDGETLFVVFSTTKGITAGVIHLLAERVVSTTTCRWPGATGRSSASTARRRSRCARCSRTWSARPSCQMASDGKTLVTGIGQKRGGVPGLTPLWTPGTATGYHAANLRLDPGRSGAASGWAAVFRTIVQDEICRPLGIDSLFVGLPDAMQARVARHGDRRFGLAARVARGAGPPGHPRPG